MTGSAAGESSSQPGDGQKLFSRTFALGWLITFSFYLVFYFLITIMALYAIKEFAASDLVAGFASSSFVVGATIARFSCGYIVDRFGRRRVLILASILAVIASVLYIPADSLVLLIGVRLLHGFAFCFASTAAMAVTQLVIPPSRRAEGTGYLSLTSTLATAVGPALALFLVGTFNYQFIFWVTLAVTVATLVLSLLVEDPLQRQEGAPTRWSIKTIVHPAVVPVAVFMMMIGLCYAGVITYLNPYAENRDVIAGAGLFFIAYATSMLIMRTFLGRVQDRHGPTPVIVSGLVAFAIALAILAVADTDWLVVVAGALTGMGYGTLMPAAQAITVDAVPAAQIGTGLSTLFLFTDLGFGLGPVLLGVLLGGVGYGGMFAMLSGVVVLAGIYYAATRAWRQRPAR